MPMKVQTLKLSKKNLFLSKLFASFHRRLQQIYVTVDNPQIMNLNSMKLFLSNSQFEWTLLHILVLS